VNRGGGEQNKCSRKGRKWENIQASEHHRFHF
jgi:hypothetical protein